MKISRDWLSDFVTWIETDPAVIAERLTRSMGEIDKIEQQGKYLDGVVVGKVKNLRKHPQADRLSVCEIETESGIKHVVCGGTNLRDDMLVAFAHIDATVLAGGKEEVTLTRVKIRGEDSEGMICAAEEIELQELFPSRPEDGSRPIADLTSRNFVVGTALRDALNLHDVVFHIDNHAITNRPDLFSHIGVARECVALGLAVPRKRTETPAPTFAKTAIPFTLNNDVPHLVTDYSGCLLRMEGTGETPDWMKRRLEATGWRSINLVVDITNYVLMEVGMPLHAFDADDFRGTVTIRAAKKGESITTLDNVKRPLPEGAVVISDDEGIFDLFGVMGGLRTSNKSGTTHIFVQAGVIDPVSVRRTMIAMAHRTDAGTVYEKGVSLATAKAGLARAVELFTTLHPQAVLISKEVAWGKMQPKKAVQLSVEKITDLIGATISPAQVQKILSDLGCTVTLTTNKLTVTPPPWRNDLTIAEDLIEEVARIYGYAEITPIMPEASIVPPDRETGMNLLRDALSEEGYNELIHLAFSSPQSLQKLNIDPATAVSIENPLGEELSLMRPSLVPSLLQTVGREVRRSEASYLKAFEYGCVFSKDEQQEQLCLVVAAKGKVLLSEEPLLVAKADLHSACKRAGYSVTFQQTNKHLPAFAHAGRSATILCEGKSIGLLTEVQPQIAKTFDLPSRTAVAMIDWDALRVIPSTVTIFQLLPAFPSVEFDETIPMPTSSFGSLTQQLKNLDTLLRAIRIVHLYDDGVTRNLTLRFTYRSDDRTLTQEEVKTVHAKVVQELQKASTLP
jgi:phenylalanyl-tRNA synthetase beta chain